MKLGFMMAAVIATSVLYGTGLAAGATEPLKFDSNGEFKILQLTDFHYIHADSRSQGAIECIENVIEAVKPDLIVVTGDMIYGAPAKEGIEDVVAMISAHGIPFCTTFGNHDDEFGLSRAALYDIISADPNCLNPDRATLQCYDTQSPDYALEVLSSAGDKVAQVLWCLDSHSYSGRSDVSGYAWFNNGQICWYRNLSHAYKEQNGGTPVPSLAFFHIPLPEVNYGITDENVAMIGHHLEYIGCGRINSGMFANMLECGDIYGVFYGHEHDNDFAMDYYGICLAYGRYSGGATVYNHMPNGGRVIVLHEGRRSFDSHIVLRDGTEILPFTWPDDFRQPGGVFAN